MNALNRAQPIKRVSLHQELADKIRELIEDGQLPTGAKVPELELCERFGVSRTPLREALKVLAVDRIVSLEPRRGAWVARITVEDVDEVFPVMGVLEGLAGELACARITDAELAGINRLHEEMLVAYRNGDRADFFALNRRIHEAILTASGNGTLIDQYNSLASRVASIRYMARMNDEQWETSVAEHTSILRFLNARDGTGLSSMMRSHVNQKARTVRAWIETISQKS